LNGRRRLMAANHSEKDINNTQGGERGRAEKVPDGDGGQRGSGKVKRQIHICGDQNGGAQLRCHKNVYDNTQDFLIRQAQRGYPPYRVHQDKKAI